MADPRPSDADAAAPRQPVGDVEPAVWNPVRPGEAGAAPAEGQAPGPAANPPRASRRWRNCLLGCLGAVALLVVVVVGTALILWWLWRSEPEPWTRQQAAIAARPPADLAADGERLEKSVVNEVSKVGAAALRPPPEGESRTIHLPLTDVNAWLATRLGDWLANQGRPMPVQVKGVMVTTEGKDIVLAVKAHAGQRAQVFSAALEVTPAATGTGVTVRLKSLRGGRLGLPVGMIAALVGGTGDALQAAQLARALQEGVTLSQPLEMGGRALILETVDAKPDAIDVKVRVQPR